jgi:hypothetical protein
MRKTSVYLTAEELQRLADLARLEGVSQAKLIREAISAYEGRRSADREFQLEGIGEGPGGSIADIPEQELLDEFGE